MFIKTFAPEIEKEEISGKRVNPTDKALLTQRSQETGMRLPTRSDDNDSEHPMMLSMASKSVPCSANHYQNWKKLQEQFSQLKEEYDNLYLYILR